jgi:hypothetical protein
MKEKFTDIKFRADTLAVINHANTILDEYQAQGFKLTLRQLYYQFVARALLPNKQSEYKRLGSIIDNGRQAGLIDWAAIEDRTRNLERLSTWDSPQDILSAVTNQYREDWWLHQPFYPEVWIEKDALTGIIEPTCHEFRVPFFACRGYVSQSEMYDAAQRLKRVARSKRNPVIFHLGDHDPSGMHMTEDNGNRLDLFMRGYGIEVVRLALNMNQIEEYDPPPNPAKETDSRFESYAAEHGESSWELDALDPVVIANLIRDALEERIEPEPWQDAKDAEEKNREHLIGTSENWERVKLFLKHRESQAPYNDDADAMTVDDMLDDLEAGN